MPNKKRAVKKTKSITSDILNKNEINFSDESTYPSGCSCSDSKKNKTPLIIGILGIILLIALATSKGYIVAAIVNNTPIFRFQLDNVVMSRYGKTTLESMISEKLIDQESKKAGIKITQAEIDAQEEEVLKSFGGKVTLDELLKFQGLSKSDFDGQVRLQLQVNKLLEKDVTVTDEEIATYMETNKSLMVSSDDATMKEEARKALTEQKINEKVQSWFTEVKNNAKIFKFVQ